MTTQPDISDLPPPPGTFGWPWQAAAPAAPRNVERAGSWPCITVVTPSFNQAPYLEQTIRSVLLQGYPNLRYIVMDGGSTDGSVEIIRRYEPWLFRWSSEKDRGQSHAINKALSGAGGDLLAYLNSDDIYMPGALFTAAVAFQDHPGVDLVYGDCQLLDAEGRTVETWKSREYDLLSELCRNFIYQPTVLMRRKVYDEVGGFDEDLHYAMDIDFWYRASEGRRFLYLPLPLAGFRVTRDSKTGRSRKPFVMEREEVLNRFLENCRDERIRKSSRLIRSWHHFHGGEQLYSRGEKGAARAEFFRCLLERPLSLRTPHCLAGAIDAALGTSLFLLLSRIHSPSPPGAKGSA